MLRALFIAFALLIAFDEAFAVDIEKNEKGPDAASAQQTQKDSTPSSIVTVVSDAWSRSTITVGDWLHRFHEEIIAFATLGLFFVTTALAIYTAKLWWSTSELVEESKNTSQIELRAYLSVDSANVVKIITGQIPRAKIIVKNTGKTPAYQVTILGGIAMGESFEKLPPPTTNRGGDGDSKGALASGGWFPHENDAPFSLNDSHVAKLQSGALKIYAHGKIAYSDVFKKKWNTPYRFVVGEIDAMGNGRLRVCGEGNDPD